MLKRQGLLAVAIMISNVIVQMPVSSSSDVAGSSSFASRNSPEQAFTLTSPPVAKSSNRSTPSQVLIPQRPLGPRVTLSPTAPRLLAERIAGQAYARLAPSRHQAPQLIRRVSLVGPMSRTLSVPSTSSPSGRSQTLGAWALSRSVVRPLIVITGTTDSDGIDHWWTYEEDILGGVGKYLINIANGNLIVQSDDMAVPNKGIELAFRRTYNSMSNHTYANGDGSAPSLYGDKWTNTFDAHIAFNDFAPVNGQKGVSLYDIDGARYDYAPVGDGHNFTPPAGQFALLYYDGTGYSWTKKSGTVYYFWDLNQPTSPALAGQVETIYGRNHNNYLSFARTYTPDASTPTNLVTMTVTAEDGRVATLTYGNVPQNCNPCYRVLASLSWPDGSSTVSYGYVIQIQGNNLIGPELYEVTSPGNGSTTSGTLVQQYGYISGTQFLSNVDSPRYVCAIVLTDCSNNPIATGPTYTFAFDASNRLAHVYYFGDVNPSITDASGSGYLQPGATHDLGSVTSSRSVSVAYSSGSSTWSDSDGHQNVYSYDVVGRVTQVSQTTGDPSGGVTALTPKQQWDANNNLIAFIDPRGNETDYAYDAGGNGIAVAQPAPTPGAFRPTSYYSYDSNNNVTAACDPVAVHNASKDWTATPAPSDTLCSTANGITQLTQYTWTAPTGGYQPDGELTQTKSPLGYTINIFYDSTRQGSSIDFGLPTQTKASAIISQYDGTNIQPEQDFVYDVYGNLICYSKQLVNGQPAWSVLQYDSGHLGRVLKIGDADDASMTNASCSRVPGIAGSTITNLKTYFANGQVATTQDPSELAASVVTAFTYDADGNETTEQHHYGGTPASPPPSGITTKLYDGADRLVEVELPNDSRSWTSLPQSYDSDDPHLTRYDYDLSEGGTLGTINVAGTTVTGFGNLFKTQEYLPNPYSKAWVDVKGTGFDALDRVVAGYFFAPGDATLHSSATTYDLSGQAGLKSKTCEVPCSTFSYDNIGRLTQTTFNDGTATISESYDAAARPLTATSGTDTQSYQYDVEGHLLTSTEPASIGSPATLTYDYYPNGWRKDLSVSSSSLTQTDMLQYAYQANGQLKDEQFNHLSDSARIFSWAYTPAGREMTANDPYMSPAQSLTYDLYGRLGSETLAAGQYTSIAYGDEGEMVGYTAVAQGLQFPEPFSYNVRGGLAAALVSFGSIRSSSYYGAIRTCNWAYDSGSGQYDYCGAGPQQTFDPKEGILTAWQDDNGQGPTFHYDVGGRQDSATFSESYPLTWTGSFTRSYDAQNHLTKQVYVGYPAGCRINKLGYEVESFTQAYVWGPNGHPMKVGTNVPTFAQDNAPPQNNSAIGYESMHWDGDTLLFTTNGHGTVDDIKIGAIAELTPLDPTFNGFTVWDRGPDGQIASAHHWNNQNQVVHGVWGTADPLVRGCQNFSQTTFSQGSSGWSGPSTFATGIGAAYSMTGVYLIGQGGLVTEPRTDGISDGINVIQGVRAYDSTLQGWTTPDAYAGVQDDPMSQKPYTWNKNNPVAYTDPSGFTAFWSRNGNDVVFVFLVHFVLDKGVTRADVAQFIANTESRLSTQAGKYNVRTVVRETAATGPRINTVTIHSSSLTPGGNPLAQGIPASGVMEVGNDYSRWGPNRTSGTDAHELWHTTYNNHMPGNHTNNPQSIMYGPNGGNLENGTLTEEDVNNALNCTCNTQMTDLSPSSGNEVADPTEGRISDSSGNAQSLLVDWEKW
jgi:YD repeat-containing protein